MPIAARGCCLFQALQDSCSYVAEPCKVILKSCYPQLAKICWHYHSGSDETVGKIQEIVCCVGDGPSLGRG
jgi:hypothetical protein